MTDRAAIFFSSEQFYTLAFVPRERPRNKPHIFCWNYLWFTLVTDDLRSLYIHLSLHDAVTTPL